MTSYSPWFTPASHVLCRNCQMQGPIACSQREEDAIGIQDLECLAEPTEFEADAIAAWNSLPRRPDYNDVDCAGCPERRRGYLTWTTEPPKVEGFYWWKCEQEQPDAPLMVHADFFEGEFHYMFIYEDGPCFHECDKCHWAGPIPIPMPLEPEES